MTIIGTFPPPWRSIIEEACAARRMGIRDVVGRGRQPRVVRRRHLIWLALQEQCGASHAEIARRFGFDRSTVRYGVQQARKRRAAS